ncbi:hypothetical protein MAQ5080_00576 [Marinomonas aquimarina]|uniref:Uncharacterized protein n=1 Tax=Marinomonas aquimarina TaxID=295068 RepID=A0A1A8T5U9_9GAMM|nr:hypothetical protein [Marinomonas aquimarina]SBS26640.1 hypothetical protein MAQ5080_00576 [Marinomonas aquimarina]
MKVKTLVELLESVDTTYLTESEKAEAIARAQAAEYTAELIASGLAWVKKALVGKRTVMNTANHSHA